MHRRVFYKGFFPTADAIPTHLTGRCCCCGIPVIVAANCRPKVWPGGANGELTTDYSSSFMFHAPLYYTRD